MNLLKYIAIFVAIVILSGCNTNKTKFVRDNLTDQNVNIHDLEQLHCSYSPEKVFKMHIVDEKTIEENFYKQRIPKEFADAFLYYTRNFPELRMAFYSIMVHESGNFKVYKRKNTNGSYDLGPSHLNSNNIKNAYFRELYNPKDESHITSVYCFYMVMSINYFHDMVDKFNWDLIDAFYAYNGGQKAPAIIKSNYIPKGKVNFVKNVKAYANAISNNIYKFSEELESYKTEINDQIQYGLTYLKDNINQYRHYSDVYIDFDSNGKLVMNLTNTPTGTIASNRSSLPNHIENPNNNVVINIRREDYALYLLENKIVIS